MFILIAQAISSDIQCISSIQHKVCASHIFQSSETELTSGAHKLLIQDKYFTARVVLIDFVSNLFAVEVATGGGDAKEVNLVIFKVTKNGYLLVRSEPYSLSFADFAKESNIEMRSTISEKCPDGRVLKSIIYVDKIATGAGISRCLTKEAGSSKKDTENTMIEKNMLFFRDICASKSMSAVSAPSKVLTRLGIPCTNSMIKFANHEGYFEMGPDGPVNYLGNQVTR